MSAPYEEVDFGAPDEVREEELDAIEVMWMERNARPFTPTFSRPMRATRCTGITRNGPRAGKRCGRESTLGTSICEAHGANLPVVKEAAARRVTEYQFQLLDMGPVAIEGMRDLAENAQSEAVRLKTYTEILDRIGVRGGTDLNVTVETVDTAAEAVRERLEMLRRRVIEGELADENALNSANRAIEHVTVDPVDVHNPAEE